MWTHGDGLLSVLAPIGMAAAMGTGLIVDLDPDGPDYGGATSLADLVEHGPRRDHLRPTNRGLAVLSNGGIRPAEAAPIVDALLDGWPTVVLRSAEDRGLFAPVVPVYPLLPGLLARDPGRFCVFQETGFSAAKQCEGIVIPRPRSRMIRRLLSGVLPAGSRWIRAWRQVWDHSWA
jgi:hypothetical protein